MKWNTKKNIFCQATVVLILLVSMTVSAIHPAIPSGDVSAYTVETMFHYGDVPFITVTVTPPGLVFGKCTFEGNLFATLELPDEGVTTVVGEAQLPTISRFLEIPVGATPQLVVESVSWETTSLDALQLPSSILPVQPSLVKTEGAAVPFCRDDAFYSTDAFLPSVIADVSVLGEMRGRHVAFLQVSPVQYNPVSGELRMMTHCDIRIDLPGSDLVKTAEMIDRYTTASFEELFRTWFVNYGDLQGTNALGLRQEGYLIIVHTGFYDAIQPLAAWKETAGFSVTVTKTSDISGGLTKENIKAYIVDAYNSWEIPPAYVLLVGDVEQIPTWSGAKTGTVTDLYYVTIDQGNYFADIIVSRFPAANSAQVTVMVDKTIYYEQGFFPDDSWIKKAAFIASDDAGGTAEQTHNYVTNTYLLPYNYTCDKIYESTGGTTAHITNALNDGRSLCVYSGHGYSGGWACVPFNQNNVNALQNQGMYPFVCSHACSTNPFNNAECFGETWVRAENKGGLAFWGASASTYWDEDDILEKRMFKAWWEDNLETIGGMTNMALYYLYQHYSGGGWTQYYFEAYNVLGDSSVKIWRDTPNPNFPPDTPDEPVGPDDGQVGLTYAFSATTVDPEDDDVFFLFDWGDGNVSDWIGPVLSGGVGDASHSWVTPGEYPVTVKAKDVNGRESGWSVAHPITIFDAPLLQVQWILGGLFMVKALISNNGGVTATNVQWSITLTGGAFIGKETTGTIGSLAPGEQQYINSKIILGFGGTVVSVSATVPESTALKTQEGMIRLFYIKL
jgi:hypothetical protein